MSDHSEETQASDRQAPPLGGVGPAEAGDVAVVPQAGLAAYGTACFLCHRPFGDDVTYTEEDVVPKWLLRLCGLGNGAADLPNGQVFRYSQRKVPCCWDCNQRMSRELEKPVSAAFQQGFDAVSQLDPTLLFLWLAKVYYGTRFRETDLRTEVANPDSAKMLDLETLLSRNDYLRRCALHHPEALTLTAPPASIFLFRAGVPSVPQHRFDFFVPTSPGSDMMALRVADTFLICVFGDNGYWGQRLGSIRLVQAALAELVLHPVQCVDLMLWFAAEVAGHDSFGCFDMVTTVSPDGDPRTLFWPQFKVERNEVPQEMLNVARVNSMLTRLGSPPKEDDLERAARGSYPTTLLNADLDELVQATCFEVRCPAVLRQAGWKVTGEPCQVC